MSKYTSGAKSHRLERRMDEVTKTSPHLFFTHDIYILLEVCKGWSKWSMVKLQTGGHQAKGFKPSRAEGHSLRIHRPLLTPQAFQWTFEPGHPCILWFESSGNVQCCRCKSARNCWWFDKCGLSKAKSWKPTKPTVANLPQAFLRSEHKS